MSAARTLIVTITPEGPKTVLDRPTMIHGTLGEVGLTPPKRPAAPERKPPRVTEIEMPPPMTVEVVPPKKATS